MNGRSVFLIFAFLYADAGLRAEELRPGFRIPIEIVEDADQKQNEDRLRQLEITLAQRDLDQQTAMAVATKNIEEATVVAVAVAALSLLLSVATVIGLFFTLKEARITSAEARISNSEARKANELASKNSDDLRVQAAKQTGAYVIISQPQFRSFRDDKGVLNWSLRFYIENLGDTPPLDLKIAFEAMVTGEEKLKIPKVYREIYLSRNDRVYIGSLPISLKHMQAVKDSKASIIYVFDARYRNSIDGQDHQNPRFYASVAIDGNILQDYNSETNDVVVSFGIIGINDKKVDIG